MRLLTCGGRAYSDAVYAFATLDVMHEKRPVTTLIHGAAPGADTLGGMWATLKGVPVEAYPADWSTHGNAAGPIRNALMLRDGKPDAVVVFAGGVGTGHMVGISRKADVLVEEVPALAQSMSAKALVRLDRISSKAADRLDITRKSGTEGLPFAPSWDILSPALAARKRADGLRFGSDAVLADKIETDAWAKYVPAYLAEMRESYKRSRWVWDAVLARESVTLVCYCTNGRRCHRYLLGGVLGRLGARVLGEVRRDG